MDRWMTQTMNSKRQRGAGSTDPEIRGQIWMERGREAARGRRNTVLENPEAKSRGVSREKTVRRVGSTATNEDEESRSDTAWEATCSMSI